MITKINETKTVKHISCDCKCKFNSAKLIQIKNGIVLIVNVNVRATECGKKIIVGILALAFARIVGKLNKKEVGKVGKIIGDDSVIVCNEILRVMVSSLANSTNAISTNFTNTVPIHCDDKRVPYKKDYFTRFYCWPYYYLWSPLFAIILENIGQVKKISALAI